jgi:hypothetical protein
MKSREINYKKGLRKVKDHNFQQKLEKIIKNEDVQPKENLGINPYDSEIHITTISVKNTYLPAVLVTLKLFENNAEARDYITKEGIFVNTIRIFNVDFTTHSSNFEILFKNQKYTIIKV